MRIALLAAVAAGALVAVQSVVLGAFGARMDPLVAATWVHLGGATFGVAAVLLLGRGLALDALRDAPWGPTAGIAGILLIAGIAIAVGGIGLASTLAVVTGTQLVVGLGIEALGPGGRLAALDPTRIGGAALIVVGAYLVVARAPSAG